MIIIDSEFRDELRRLNDAEYKALEQSILQDGCRDALIVWQEEDIMVDGHHRYEICERHNIEYRVEYMSFESRTHALVWMHRNQRARRNENNFDKAESALKMAKRMEELGRQNMSIGGKGGFQNSENLEALNSWEQAAKHYETSRDTMSRVKTIQEQAPPEIRAAAASGELSVNAAYEETKLHKKLETIPQYSTDILQKKERENLAPQQAIRIAESIEAAPSEQARKILLDMPYESTLHNHKIISERKERFGAHDPLFRANKTPTIAERFADTPQTIEVLDMIKAFRKQLEGISEADKAGRFSPEGREFVARRLQDTIIEIKDIVKELLK